MHLRRNVGPLGRGGTERRLARALANGGYVDAEGRVLWPMAGDCEDPVSIEESTARATNTARDRDPALPALRELVQLVRCRRCARCISQRRRMWIARAHAEAGAAHRSWFVTLTLYGSVVRTYLPRVEERLGRSVARPWTVDEHGEVHGENQLRCWDKVLAPEVQKYLKRLRERSAEKCGGTLRFLQVVEPHKDGLPHFHLLIHEHGGRATRKRIIRKAWPHGITHAVLVQDCHIAYVAKYAAKRLSGRVRASLRYGARPDAEPQDTASASASAAGEGAGTTPTTSQGELRSPENC